jgi:phosphatidate phosphatase PAH1
MSADSLKTLACFLFRVIFGSLVFLTFQEKTIVFIVVWSLACFFVRLQPNIVTL